MDLLNTTNLDEISLFKERLSIALKAAKICVFEVDLVQQLYTFFENSEDIFGVAGYTILEDVQPYSKLKPEEYRLAVSDYFSHPDDEAVIKNAFSDTLSGKSTTYQARMRAGGSKFIWCKIDVTPIVQDGIPKKMIGVITDISHLKQQNELLQTKALTDTFTGMYNKEHSITLIKECLRQDGHLNHAFLLVDIDNFKYYNDIYGHFEGDKAIRAVADLIKKTFRVSDISGRFGGDEFMIFIKNVPNEAWLCEKIQHLLQVQICEHAITTSIGIAIFPQDATTFDELFQKADKALYCSKVEKSSFSFFSECNRLS